MIEFLFATDFSDPKKASSSHESFSFGILNNSLVPVIIDLYLATGEGTKKLRLKQPLSQGKLADIKFSRDYSSVDFKISGEEEKHILRYYSLSQFIGDLYNKKPGCEKPSIFFDVFPRGVFPDLPSILPREATVDLACSASTDDFSEVYSPKKIAKKLSPSLTDDGAKENKENKEEGSDPEKEFC